MFGGKYIRTTMFPDEALGFYLETALNNQLKIFEVNENEFKNQMNEFDIKVKNKEFVIEKDLDESEFYCSSKEVTEFFLTDYYRLNCIMTLVMMMSYFDHYFCLMCSKFLDELKIKLKFDRKHLTFRDYYDKLVQDKFIKIKSNSSNYNFLIKTADLRNFYIHPPNESKLERVIGKLMNGVLRKYLDERYLYNNKKNIFIKDSELLIKTKECALEIIYNISEHLHYYRKNLLSSSS